MEENKLKTIEGELEAPADFTSPDVLYRDLVASIRKYHPSDDLSMIEKAYQLADNAHKDQKRKSGEPYIIHPLCVAIILADLEMDKETIAAGLLHDVVEDTVYTEEQLAEIFGKEVALLVDGVTKLTQLSWSADKVEMQAENLRKMFLAMAKDIRVIIIKLADRLHNMRTLQYMRPEKQKEKARETIEIYSPLADRLGISKIKIELDDLALRYLEPNVYKELEEKIALTSEARQKFIDDIIAEIKTHMENAEIRCEVNGRVKHFFSIYKKMLNQHKTLDQIYDIFAVRIIVDSVKDCYAALGVIHEMYKPIPGRFKDYIAMPKPNMYQSLHTTLIGTNGQPFEIQIRTFEMHRTAEYGIAAHWKYKGGSSDSIIENWLNELREILESNNENALELLDDMKINLQDKEVHVFTPKGDLITLQAGATLLDFAYAIHTNIGSKCVGGIVNHRNETLKYVLKNGDQVSIITAANQQPKADWLSFTVTSKARNKIRQYLNEEINHQADIGKETLMRRLKNWKIEFNDEVIRKLMQHYKYKFALDLYHGIAIGKHDPSEIKEILTQVEEKPAPVVPPKDIKVVRPKKIDEDVLLIDKNVDNVEYKFARCCNPVYGDDIIGFVSIGEGIKVHRRQCKNALELVRRYPYRIVKTRWTNDGATSYQTVLNLTGKEDGNIINKITELIAKDPHATLRAISINAAEGVFDGNITVLIDNTEHLSQLISRLKHLEGVVRVNRHDSMLED